VGVRRRLALERRVRRMARQQARGPVCSPGAHQPEVDEPVWVRSRRGGPRTATADGSRKSVPFRPLCQSGEILGHQALLRLRGATPDQRGCGAV